MSVKKKQVNINDINNSPRERILDVQYTHLTLNNGDDLYLTEYGLKHWQNFLPENFILDKEWFNTNSKKLLGTSCVFKVKTKPASGESSNIVIKWNRMGEDIPGGASPESDLLADARFLSPFEEFKLLEELYESVHYHKKGIELQEPLAIYIPSDKKDHLQQLRRKYLIDHINRILEKDVKIDINRSYVMIYRWIEGINAMEANKQGFLSETEMKEIAYRADTEIQKCGYIIRDNKALHVIVYPIGNNLLRDGNNNVLYGYVDYELLERTPQQDELIRKKRRYSYLQKMPKRFQNYNINVSNLNSVNIFQVPYIYGEVPSTKGRLWIVGNDPFLFDYFLPEKWWKTDRTKLSLYNDIYYTISKDDINFVLKIPKVGVQPDVDPYNKNEKKILEFGFNSPFEEFSLALELNSKEILTIYPRAIYRSGNKSNITDRYFDNSRYKSHAQILCPNTNESILMENYEYVMILGYWNGTDEMLSDYDGNYYSAINALSAYRNGLISEKNYIFIMKLVKDRMKTVGIEDLNLRGTHILLSLNSSNQLILTDDGIPQIRICNFEFLRRSKC